MKNHALFGTAAAVATLGAFFLFSAPSEAEAKCKQSNPCNQRTAVVNCPGGAVHVSGAAEVVCEPAYGGQLVGIVGGGVSAEQPQAKPKKQKQVATETRIRKEKPVQAAAAVPTGKLSTRGSCGSGAFQGDVTTIMIMPCPEGGSATYIAGVPGQQKLIANGLIALAGGAGSKCLWVKTVKANNGGYTFMGKPVTTKLIVLPGNGVLRADGSGVAYVSSATIAGLELAPGACKGRTKGFSVNELIALKRR